MSGQVLILTIILVPVIGAFILPLVGRVSIRARNILALTMVAASFVASAIALPAALNGEPYQFAINLPLNLNIVFTADGLALFMAMISSFTGAIIVLYSFGYISHYPNQNEYYLMVVLFIGAMMGLVLSSNLILLYLFWEISAICCWRLIGFFRGKEHVIKADKAFLVTVFGALVMLIGFIMIYQQTGTFDLTQMKGIAIPDAAVLMILFGILSKSATLPFHTWLPDAGVAPSPVTSLLHAAVLVKIGVYVFARLFLMTFDIGIIWHTVIPAVAAISALVSAGAAMIETDLKRIIAYSTVSQIGFIFLGLSTGSYLGAAGGLLYIMMHGIAKAGLFLCAGNVEQNAGERNITKLGGLARMMPVTAVSFLLCAFSVMGIPPFGGFFAKFMVISGAVNAGQKWIALTFVAGAVMTVIYLFRVFTAVFLGQEKIKAEGEGSPSMLVSVGLLAFLSLAGGIFINFPSNVVTNIVQNMGVIFK